jgi:uncharacterized cupredoxin-like copper-binding protein
VARTAVALSAALLLVAGLAAACGGGGGGGGQSQPAGSIKVSLSDFKFTPSTVSAKAGKVTFFLVNNGQTAHDMTILKPDGSQLQRSELVQPGDSSVFTLNDVSAGSYRFICSQPGHEQQGMTGTLTVS